MFYVRLLLTGELHLKGKKKNTLLGAKKESISIVYYNFKIFLKSDYNQTIRRYAFETYSSLSTSELQLHESWPTSSKYSDKNKLQK